MTAFRSAVLRSALAWYLSQAPQARKALILSYLAGVDAQVIDSISETLPPDARPSLAALIDALKGWHV